MRTISHVVGRLRVEASNWWRADSTARAAQEARPLPERPVAVFFAGGPVELYQLAEWLPVLEHLDARVPLVVVCTRADGARAAMRATTLPVRLAKGAPDLEALVRGAGVRGVLYVNHLERNFRMLRFPQPVHVYLGHGESDKDSSVSNQNKAYDYAFVAGEAGKERLARALHHYDADARALVVGRPQLDHPPSGAPVLDRDDRVTVLYAPTWEGDRPGMAYGSVASHGAALVRSLVQDGGFRVLYRPHPRSGTVSPAYRRADIEVRRLLDDDGHLVDDASPYGWQRGVADVCITDVSSVAYDWLATRKPLVVTEPSMEATIPESRLLAAVPRLAAADAAHAVEAVRSALASMPAGWDDLVRHYVGETTVWAATTRFEQTVLAVLGD